MHQADHTSRSSPSLAGRRRATLAVAVAVLALAASACSASVSIGGSIDEAELEQQVAEQLAATVDNGVVPSIDCPGDLDAEVGATTTCDLTVEGDDATYRANVEVTAVDDGVASFSVEVDE